MNKEIEDLYGNYAAARIDRREFFERLAVVAGGAAAATAMLPALEANAQAASIAPATSLGKPYGPQSAYAPYDYSPIIDRPKLTWPNGKRLAVWVAPNIEFFHLNEVKSQGEPPNIFPWSRLDYGNRVGVFRMMEVLAKRKIRATVCLNSDICIYHPRIVEEGMKLDWEWMGHGETQTKPTGRMKREEQNTAISNSLAVIEKFTGKRPTGWMGTGGMETYDTPELLSANGIRYVGDWLSDEQPFYMNVGNPRLISMPYTGDLNDKSMIDGRNVPSGEFGDMIKRQFDVLYEESATTAKVMCIALHPWLIGVPHRIGALNSALDHVMGHDDVWFATGNEIAEAFAKQVKA